MQDFYYSKQCNEDINTLEEYVNGDLFKPSLVNAYDQLFPTKAKMAAAGDRSSSNQMNQWSQQFKFLIRQCEDITWLKLYRDILEKSKTGKLRGQDVTDRVYIQMMNSTKPEQRLIGVSVFPSYAISAYFLGKFPVLQLLQEEKLAKSRDWKWSSFCNLPNIPKWDIEDCLKKLSSGLMSTSEFRARISSCHEAQKASADLCWLLESYGAKHPDSAIGTFMAEMKINEKKNPFDAVMLYVRTPVFSHPNITTVALNYTQVH